MPIETITGADGAITYKVHSEIEGTSHRGVFLTRERAEADLLQTWYRRAEAAHRLARECQILADVVIDGDTDPDVEAVLKERLRDLQNAVWQIGEGPLALTADADAEGRALIDGRPVGSDLDSMRKHAEVRFHAAIEAEQEAVTVAAIKARVESQSPDEVRAVIATLDDTKRMMRRRLKRAVKATTAKTRRKAAAK